MATIDDLSSQWLYHGTKADLKPGDLIEPGYNSNYRKRKAAYVYLTATLDAATWGAELSLGIMGDMRPRSESRLAVLPSTTHVTLMERGNAIIPMVSDFLDAKSQKTN